MLQKPEFSGKVNLPEGGKDLLNWGMQALGYDYNSPKIAQWREAADYLTKNVVAHVNAFGGTFTPDQIHSGKVVAMTTDSAVARRAILQSPGLKYAILAPQSQLWVDNYTIIKGSPNKEQAYSFISHMLQPTVQVTETEELGYATALKGIEDKIDSSFKHPEVVFPSANDYEHLVPSELNEDVQGEIDKLASQVTASAA